MRLRFLFSVISLLIIASFSYAQHQNAGPDGGARKRQGGAVSGFVYDLALDIPIEYASIILFSTSDNSQAAGFITDSEGKFNQGGLRLGSYFAIVNFLGYEELQINDIKISRQSKNFDMGTIGLEQTSVKMNDVNYVVQRAPIEYKIDKKIVNVGRQSTAASGTAIDVLENIPSVTVDIEGDVQLRGSGNFTVLIDGRPSILDANDALRQIPASAIDNIEIITNPSAKYEPDGKSGIFNIILKKNKLNGTSGKVSTNFGSSDRYGGDALYNIRNSKSSLTLSANYNKRFSPGTLSSDKWASLNDTTNYNKSSGGFERGRTSYSFRASYEYNLTPKNLFTIGGRIGHHGMERNSERDYSEWTSVDATRINSNTNSEVDRFGNFYSANLDYIHKFSNEDHTISAKYSIFMHDMEEETLDEQFDANSLQILGRKSTEVGPSTRNNFKIDYTLPLTEKSKFESGYQARMGHSEDETGFSQYDPTTNLYVAQPSFDNAVDYSRNIHSMYAIYLNEVGKFGYQGGIRGEYTDRKIEINQTGEEFVIDRKDLYPTGHISYQFTDETQMMASYSRRIDRPRGWFFEPFVTWRDANNVRRGNPAIKPEYIDSYEFGGLTKFGTFNFSTELYYRQTQNLVEFVQSIYEGDRDVTMHTVENVGDSYTSGAEFSIEGNLYKWWNVNLMTNIYNSKVEGTLYGSEFSNETDSYSVRLNNMWRVPLGLKMQVNSIYNSPEATSQGKTKEFFVTNLSLERSFMDRSLTAILQVRDVFHSAEHNRISEGPNFSSNSVFTPDTPMITLTLRYNINNYRSKERPERNGGDSEGNDDF
jgi:outer membrane receptor protein involved in Fe transport